MNCYGIRSESDFIWSLVSPPRPFSTAAQVRLKSVAFRNKMQHLRLPEPVSPDIAEDTHLESGGERLNEIRRFSGWAWSKLKIKNEATARLAVGNAGWKSNWNSINYPLEWDWCAISKRVVSLQPTQIGLIEQDRTSWIVRNEMNE